MDDKKKEGEKKEETTAIVVREGGMTLAETQSLGSMFVKSGYFKDAKDEAKAVVKILAGREMGVPPIAAMQGINWINDKLTLGANLMAAIVKKSTRYNFQVIKHTDKECEIEFTENGKISGKSVFTMADAEKAGITGNSVWKKYPRNMLFARAMSNGVRWYCPDQFGGSAVYVPEEMGAEVDGEGNLARPIDVPSREVPPKDAQPIQPQAPEVDDDRPEAVPVDLIRPDTTPRKAWELLNEWFYKKNRRDELSKKLESVVSDDIKYNYQIPESALVKMVKDLTGIEMAMVEGVSHCQDCKDPIPEPEFATLKGLCQKCYDKKHAN